ncbi:DUF5685 family protein [Candidatus Clostridium stratigraminis]|uniref:DUF5685 family protein n=1 Tax=Candidatus Clostridium stratigraminis TaxID=3381661 RepID=A0ABW8T1V5_9CLOT
MFGYVTPCKMELKIKDFEKFKAYYCGLCRSIKRCYGNLPRLALNYDMTFLALLLDSLSDEKNIVEKQFCSLHPLKKRVVFMGNSAIDYAAFFNVLLAYYKLLDNFEDDKSLKSKIYAAMLKIYLKKSPSYNKEKSKKISEILKTFSIEEKAFNGKNLDELSHHFADLTGYILASYEEDKDYEDRLYKLGYNLGKWIYIIDAYDDLEKDMKNSKFNAINSAFNSENLPYKEFAASVKERIYFLLTMCGAGCIENLNKLPIKRNYDLLYNILQYGLMEKMDKIFNGKEESSNEKSL